MSRPFPFLDIVCLMASRSDGPIRSISMLPMDMPATVGSNLACFAWNLGCSCSRMRWQSPSVATSFMTVQPRLCAKREHSSRRTVLPVPRTPAMRLRRPRPVGEAFTEFFKYIFAADNRGRCFTCCGLKRVCLHVSHLCSRYSKI